MPTPRTVSMARPSFEANRWTALRALAIRHGRSLQYVARPAAPEANVRFLCRCMCLAMLRVPESHVLRWPMCSTVTVHDRCLRAFIGRFAHCRRPPLGMAQRLASWHGSFRSCVGLVTGGRHTLSARTSRSLLGRFGLDFLCLRNINASWSYCSGGRVTSFE